MAKCILQSVCKNPDRTMVAVSLMLSYCCAQADNSASMASDFPYSRLDGNPVSVSEPNLGMFKFSYRETESVPEQYDPLSSVMSIEFGDGIVTVGDAVNQVLVPLGFDLVSDGARVSRLLPELLAKPLPEVQRSMEHLRAREILRTLAGPGFVLVADMVHRAVTFDPRPRYLPLGQESTPSFQPVSIVPVLPSDTSVERDEWTVIRPTQSTTAETVSGADAGNKVIVRNCSRKITADHVIEIVRPTSLAEVSS